MCALFFDVFELGEFCGVFWNALHPKCHTYTLDWSENGIVVALLSRDKRRQWYWESKDRNGKE
jgi:hypothetical protein